MSCLSRQSFFTPPLNPDGSLSKLRVALWTNICRVQFNLVYYGRFSYEAVENMPVHEREHYHFLLLEELEKKKKAIESSVTGRRRRR